MVLGVGVSIYVDYNLNHVTFDEHVYTLDSFHDGGWHFNSESGETFMVTESTGKNYVHVLSDLIMIIDQDTYEIKSEFEYNLGRKAKSEQVRFIEIDDERVDVMRIYNLISSMDDNFLFPMIILCAFITVFTCISLLYPEFLWKINMLFVTRGGEPTDFYIASTGLVGIFVWCVTVFKFLSMI
jgi:hypothetical protein